MLLPRIAKTPFLLLGTPDPLQKRLEHDYKQMVFRPVKETSEHDSEYKADVIAGISSGLSKTPDLRYSAISDDFIEMAYEQLTPLIEEWAGQTLERSWGYGVRSYGAGSLLHMHRDRVETHVVSCIVHVEDQSQNPWPLDFIDHDAVHHQILFKKGTMLFYESLCPHGRASEFDGEYYRNMYFHWRPMNWDPSPYKTIKSKFSSVEEARQSNINLKAIELIPDTWREWLIHNRDRGCDRDEMIELAMAQGLPRNSIEAVLNFTSPGVIMQAKNSAQRSTAALEFSESSGKTDELSMLDWFLASLTDSKNMPRAWKLDTPLAQVYEIPNLLSLEECKLVIESINEALEPSTITLERNNYRNSRTCHLSKVTPTLAKKLDHRFAKLLGVDPRFSEPIQGQRYDIGQQFKEHTDWFEPGTEEFITHATIGGQRTWTIMVYLNVVEKGGETSFRKLDRSYTPIPGFGLAWNNLLADGTPNQFTLHEALPVQSGNKWVITKWFRQRHGRNG